MNSEDGETLGKITTSSKAQLAATWLDPFLKKNLRQLMVPPKILKRAKELFFFQNPQFLYIISNID